MIDVKKLFAAAGSAGIDKFEARISCDGKLSVGVFDGELENYTVANDGAIIVRGLYRGKCGMFSSDRVDDAIIPMAIAALKESAEYGSPIDPELFVAGGTYEYEKLSLFNDGLSIASPSVFIDTAKRVAVLALEKDKRIEHVNVRFEIEESKKRLLNSEGLDLISESNDLTVFAEAKTNDGNGDIQSGSYYEILKSFDDFDTSAFADKLVRNALGLIGGKPIDTGKYTVVYAPDCFAVLLKTLLRGFSAFNVNNHMSLIEGKIGTNAFSKLLTVEQTPIGNEVFCHAFDAEGVPCRNMLLIDKGVPACYVYDLETAKKAGVKSTGNGSLSGGNIRPAVGFVTVHNGNMSLDGLFEKIKNGVYITELGGTSTGIDGQSGNYSLQASGYLIENGKKSTPVPLMTVAGNLLRDLSDIIAVADDAFLTFYGVKTPSVAIKNLSVSGVK